MEKQWTDDMDEISGFGGGYEAVCRAMVLAGIKWLDEHPEAKPVFSGIKDVFGIMLEDNDDARALTDAMMNAPVYLNGELLQAKVRDDCTGAMHHAAVNHCITYRQLGWEEYCRQMKKVADHE